MNNYSLNYLKISLLHLRYQPYKIDCKTNYDYIFFLSLKLIKMCAYKSIQAYLFEYGNDLGFIKNAIHQSKKSIYFHWILAQSLICKTAHVVYIYTARVKNLLSNVCNTLYEVCVKYFNGTCIYADSCTFLLNAPPSTQMKSTGFKLLYICH